MSPRLPAGAVPRHYAIELSPDLEDATFAGSVAIDIDVTEPLESIVLNAAELSIVRAQLADATGETVELDLHLDVGLFGLARRAALAAHGDVSSPG